MNRDGGWSMLDIGFHQAAGLQQLHPASQSCAWWLLPARSNAGTGLETLWQICASLQRLGYPVDGARRHSALETDEYPGFAATCCNKRRGTRASASTWGPCASVTSLAVIPCSQRPAAQLQPRGLHRNETAPLPCLLPYFRTYGLIVLHAPAARAVGPLADAHQPPYRWW